MLTKIKRNYCGSNCSNYQAKTTFAYSKRRKLKYLCLYFQLGSFIQVIFIVFPQESVHELKFGIYCSKECSAGCLCFYFRRDIFLKCFLTVASLLLRVDDLFGAVDNVLDSQSQVVTQIPTRGKCLYELLMIVRDLGVCQCKM